MGQEFNNSGRFEDFYNTYKNIYSERAQEIEEYRTKLLKKYKMRFF
jgi:hypothetical protein